jgi:hypothetical protein
MAERTLLKIDQIRRDGATQPRAAIDFETVFDYMDAMVDGAEFPPVTVFYDGTDYWLADGFHRVKAREQGGFDEIACEVHQGTQQDAQWYSFAANKTNGLRRTNDDKQRAVKAALIHPQGVGLSDRQIGSHVGVDHKTVSGWREKLEGTGEIPQSDQRTGRDGRSMNVGGIRRRRTPKRGAPSPEKADEGACATTEHPADGVETTEPALATPQTDLPADEDRSWEVESVYRAAVEIAACGMTANDLAAAIGRSNRSDQITKQLEKTNEFIAAVLAEAAIS